MKKELVILYGGRSGEHEVSLRSAASLYNHLDKEKYNITLVGIAKNGNWFLQDNYTETVETFEIKCDESKKTAILPMEGFICNDRIIKADIVFPVIHGTFGEDGTMQGLLEMGGFPYVGADVGGSYLGMDKDMSKTIWEKNDILVVPYKTVKMYDYSPERREFINKDLIDKFGLPVFVKPAKAGSSVGVYKVDKKEDLTKALLNALTFDTKVLIEPAIVGKEIECAVIGNNEVQSFLPGEVAPTHEFYDYEAKYLDSDGAGLIIPADLSDIQLQTVRTIAEKAYKSLEIKGFARVDFFLEEKSGSILLNEINTIPGFTNISMFSMMCENGGLPYSRLLDRLIELAETQYKIKEKLSFSYK